MYKVALVNGHLITGATAGNRHVRIKHTPPGSWSAHKRHEHALYTAEAVITGKMEAGVNVYPLLRLTDTADAHLTLTFTSVLKLFIGVMRDKWSIGPGDATSTYMSVRDVDDTMQYLFDACVGRGISPAELLIMSKPSRAPHPTVAPWGWSCDTRVVSPRTFAFDAVTNRVIGGKDREEALFYVLRENMMRGEDLPLTTATRKDQYVELRFSLALKLLVVRCLQMNKRLGDNTILDKTSYGSTTSINTLVSILSDLGMGLSFNHALFK